MYFIIRFFSIKPNKIFCAPDFEGLEEIAHLLNSKKGRKRYIFLGKSSHEIQSAFKPTTWRDTVKIHVNHIVKGGIDSSC